MTLTNYTADRVVLYDCPNPNDQITGGLLTFSDGSQVSFGPLNNSGAATEFTFSPRVTNNVRVTVTGTSSSTFNVGLSEIQIYGRSLPSNAACLPKSADCLRVVGRVDF